MRCFIIALVALALASQARSADTPPNWKHRPTPEDLLAVFPTAAFRQNIAGKAVITCKVAIQGTLYDCVVVRETPAGMGFGAAAVALTPQFLMTPKLHDGAPVIGEVTIPISFEAPGATGSHIQSQDTLPMNTVISDVPWIEAPTYAEVVAAYPQKARDAKVGGHAVLDCRFDRQGRLGGCSVLDERPGGYGFGAAAKALTGKFLAPREDASGASLKSASTQIPFTFDPTMLTDGKPVIGKPRWVRLPEGSEMTAGYPQAARAAHIDSALVTLSCAVGLAGRLGDCEVTRQDPAGYDFDKAAMALSNDFQVTVWTAEGLPTVGGRIHVPIHYRMEDTPPPAPAPASAPAAKP